MTKAEPDVLEGKVSSRALFLYFRGGNAEEQLKSFPEFTLWLPKRGSRRLKVEGEEVGGAETSLPLRREKGGTYVCVSSLECTGALPFEIGLKSGAGEEQRWMAGELRHHAGEEGRAGGWGMMLSTTALGGGPVLRDLRCDVEVLICCDVAPGQPACLSAHASFPTARRTSCRARVARRSSLDVISEEEKCEPRCTEQAGSLERSESGLCAKGSCTDACEAFEWDPSVGHDEFTGEYLHNFDSIVGEGDGGQNDLTWFSAGVRVGMGVGLGMCLGLGLGVGILVNTYRRTTTSVGNRARDVRDGILSFVS